MISWIAENWGTILVSFLLILIVAGIIFWMVWDKKRGKSSCGGNCAHCKMCAGNKCSGAKKA